MKFTKEMLGKTFVTKQTGSSGLQSNSVYIESATDYEKELYEYAVEKIKSFNDVNIIGHSNNKGAILSFTINNIHTNDIGMILDQHNVAVRAGHHCAQPLLKKLNLKGTVRASLGIYNNKSDIDCLVESITETKKFFSS